MRSLSFWLQPLFLGIGKSWRPIHSIEAGAQWWTNDDKWPLKFIDQRWTHRRAQDPLTPGKMWVMCALSERPNLRDELSLSAKCSSWGWTVWFQGLGNKGWPAAKPNVWFPGLEPCVCFQFNWRLPSCAALVISESWLLALLTLILTTNTRAKLGSSGPGFTPTIFWISTCPFRSIHSGTTIHFEPITSVQEHPHIFYGFISDKDNAANYPILKAQPFLWSILQKMRRNSTTRLFQPIEQAVLPFLFAYLIS